MFMLNILIEPFLARLWGISYQSLLRHYIWYISLKKQFRNMVIFFDPAIQLFKPIYTEIYLQ